MSMKIDADECTACGDCAEACPNGSISSKGAYFVVASEKCNECEKENEPQCQNVCPANCIDYA